MQKNKCIGKIEAQSQAIISRSAPALLPDEQKEGRRTRSSVSVAASGSPCRFCLTPPVEARLEFLRNSRLLRLAILPQLGETRFVKNEGKVAVPLVNNVIAVAVEPGDSPKSLAWPEPAMEFDAQLANRNVLIEELVDDVELKAFDVHLQEVDVRVSIPAHDGGEVIALEGDYFEIALRHRVGTFVGICRYGELKNAGVRREANGKELEILLLGFCSGMDAGRRWIEDENGLAGHLRQLHFEGHGFADSSAVGNNRRRIDADHPAAIVVADTLYIRRGRAKELLERYACFISDPT